MWLIILAAAILFSSLYQEGDAVYSIYQVQKIKRKLFKMTADLIFDTKSKIQHVQHIRRHYQHLKGFEYGGVLHDIRRQYARMLFIHKTLMYYINKPYKKYYEINTTRYEWYMLKAVHTGFDIDKQIEAIELNENLPFQFRKEIIDNVITTKKKKSNTGKGWGGWGGWNRLLRAAEPHGFFRHGRALKKNHNNWKGELDGVGFDSEQD